MKLRFWFVVLTCVFGCLPANAGKSPLYQFKGEYEGRVVIMSRKSPNGELVRRTARIHSAEFKAAPNVVQGGLELIVGGLREHLSFRGTAFQYKRSTINESVTLDGRAQVRFFSVGYSAAGPVTFSPRVAGFIEYLRGRNNGDLKVVVSFYSETRKEVRTYFLSPLAD